MTHQFGTDAPLPLRASDAGARWSNGQRLPTRAVEEPGLRPHHRSLGIRAEDNPRLIADNLQIVERLVRRRGGLGPQPRATYCYSEVGALPVPLMIIPCSLDCEAIDRLI
ncbi:MAG: hypothetical protein K0S66_3043 [Sphingomonas sp.]|jgi:hypothetical protein|nr:hypothetical protein [Sphingomonas sp.]